MGSQFDQPADKLLQYRQLVKPRANSDLQPKQDTGYSQFKPTFYKSYLLAEYSSFYVLIVVGRGVAWPDNCTLGEGTFGLSGR